MTNTRRDRIKTLLDGRTAPVVRIDQNGVTLNGEQLPLVVGVDPIEVSIDPDGPITSVRLTLLSAGPVIVDQRTERERNTVVEVKPAGDLDHTLEDGSGNAG